MISLAGKPLLQYTIEHLCAFGITEICLIVGYCHDQIEQFFGDGHDFGVSIKYIIQPEYLGTAHAVSYAQAFMGSETFFLIYGDLYFDRLVFSKILDQFTHSSELGISGVLTSKSMPDPSHWGIIQVNAAGLLENIIEKPINDRFGTLANMGIYLLPASIFDAIRIIPKSIRGEYELPDAILACRSKGHQFGVVNLGKLYWSDIGLPWHILDVNEYLMNQKFRITAKKSPSNEAVIHNLGGTIENAVTIHGPVEIGAETIIKAGTYIEGPVIIGHHTTIGPHAYLRPYSVIGNYCKVGNSSEIKASIIMDHTAIPHLSYIGDSILGEHVNIGCGTITGNLRLDKHPISMTVKDQPIQSNRTKLGSVIGDHASLGIQVSIMPGKTIGSYAQVGSSTVVTQNVPAKSKYFSKYDYTITHLE